MLKILRKHHKNVRYYIKVDETSEFYYLVLCSTGKILAFWKNETTRNLSSNFIIWVILLGKTVLVIPWLNVWSPADKCYLNLSIPCTKSSHLWSFRAHLHYKILPAVIASKKKRQDLWWTPHHWNYNTKYAFAGITFYWKEGRKWNKSLCWHKAQVSWYK